MDIIICVCLFLSQFLSVLGILDGNYCEFKGQRNAIPMCFDGSTSGSKVAVEASNVNSTSCKCILTRANSLKAIFVVNMNYMSSNINSRSVELYVDGKDDRNKIQTGESAKAFNNQNVELLAEQKQTSWNLRPSRKCLVIELSKFDTGATLNLFCYNGLGNLPDVNNSSNNSSVQYNTTTVTSKATSREASPSPTDFSITQSKSSTTPKHTKTYQHPDKANSTVDLTDRTISEHSEEQSTRALQGGAVEERESNNKKRNITGILAGVITAIVLLAVVVVVVVSIGVICYFKRRKRRTISKENTPPKPKGEDDEGEYEITENAMYIPTITVEQIKTNNVYADSDHMYEDADVHLKRDPCSQEEMPLILKEDQTRDLNQDKTSENTDGIGQDKAIGIDLVDGVNGVAIFNDNFPVYSQVDKSSKKTGESGENGDACNNDSR